MKRYSLLVAVLGLSVLLSVVYAQDGAYVFKDKEDIKVSPVKNQYRSGTCWSFAAIAFLEAELIRTGKGEMDLSEMYLVRKCYEDKAEKFVRMHGKTNFGGGGLAHDLIYVWEKYGLVPQDAYPGLLVDKKGHVHGEMDNALRGYVESTIENKNRQLSKVWMSGLEGILDAYLGEEPSSFIHKDASFTPESFAASLELNPSDYVTIGSFTHHPFYAPFILEIPDNWGWNEIQNVPLDDMMSVIDNALEKGYTVCWDADVSEKGFQYGKGVSLIPAEGFVSMDNLEEAKWTKMSKTEQRASKQEMEITQELRQDWFDNYQTTDDHLMLITGIAEDQDGNTFYKVKNSWGTRGVYEGYFYCSEAFMKAKTVFVMVHEDAVPHSVAKKLK